MTQPRSPTELKAKSQVKIPMQIVDEMGLEQGDLFEVVSVESEIHLVPVVVWPKARIEELRRKAALAQRERAAGAAKIYDDVGTLLADLHEAAE